MTVKVEINLDNGDKIVYTDGTNTQWVSNGLVELMNKNNVFILNYEDNKTIVNPRYIRTISIKKVKEDV